jgi:peptide deformylase
MIREVLTIPNRSLYTTCELIRDVTDLKVKQTYFDLQDTLQQYDAVGLAANQIGEKLSMCAIRPSLSLLILVMINPQIVKRRGKQSFIERCLSVPDISAQIERSDFIEVRYLDIKGTPMTYSVSGLPSAIIQHEIDHLFGIIFTEKNFSKSIDFSSTLR